MNMGSTVTYLCSDEAYNSPNKWKLNTVIAWQDIGLRTSQLSNLGTEDYADELIELSKPGNTSKIVLSTKFAEAIDSKEEQRDVIDFNPEDNEAMIIYTSGTTGRPKGVVLSYRNIMATSKNMVESWEWSKNGVSLHTLPLHHIHGLFNALLVPLSVGAECILLPRLDAKEVWSNLVDDSVTVFTTVPTIYAKLLQYCKSGNDL